MKLAIISKNKNLYSVRNFVKFAKNHFNKIDIFSYKDITVQTNDKNETLILLGRNDISEYTHIVTRVSDQYYSQRYFVVAFAQSIGIRVLNSKLITQFPYYNKLTTLSFLAKHNVPIVPTFYSLTYKNKSLPFNFPIIGKNNSGRLAKGVTKLENNSDFVTYVTSKKASNILIQPYLPSGYDIRVLIIGNKIVGAYKRTAKKTFITTKDGLNEKYDLNDQEKALVTKASRALQSDYIGLDIMYYQNKPVILEVNFDAGFKTFDQINGTNVALEIIKKLIER